MSEGGAHQIRWLDSSRLVYAMGQRIVLHDVASGKNRVIELSVKVPTVESLASQTIALRGARILPMTEGNPVIDSGSVVVKGGRIACVGKCDTASADRVIDLGGRTIMPGFVDVHAHGGFADVDLFPQHLSPQSLYLAHGVTTTLDPSVGSERFFPIAELIGAGRIVGPRSYATGEITQPLAPRTGPENRTQAGILVRRLADYGARSVKIYLTPRRDQRQMLAEAAREEGLSVTNEGADLYYNVGSIIDGHTGFEHPMHYLKLYRDVVEFFGRAGAVYSPTLIVAGAGRWAEEYHESRADLWSNTVLRRFLPWKDLVLHRDVAIRPLEEYSFPFLAEGVKDIRRAGGYGAVGGHGELWGLDTNWEIWLYATGMPAMEALAMATRDGARMLGLEDEIGTLEPGKVADLLVIDGDPLTRLQDSRNIEAVMKGGLLYEVPTLNRIWPDAVPYGTPPWLETELDQPEP